ncbi:Hypothetical predicted protein [Mytilus galloprovincialis]|uniref:B box-type domain-containing protein n=1 Tax=Mytilus galloprovincialis TaxID=29158 RepID=A0A8B6DQ54_MYTGA|nr:Hypothetical predicted protein [Mytilus galloprovincialis]
MASSSSKLCGSCKFRQITSAAMFWCTTCDEGLCSQCVEHHKTNKASRTHQSIPISMYINVESFSSSFKQECEKHEEKKIFYCPDHEITTCRLCIQENHWLCSGLKPIIEVARHAKNSVDLLDVETGFEELGKTLEELKKNRTQNISEIKDDKKTIHTKIESLREQFDKHLDDIESSIFKDLDTYANWNLSEGHQLLSDLKEKEQSIEQTRTIINMIKQINDGLSDVQVFLITKEFRTKLHELEKWSSAICQLDASKVTSLQLKINPNIEKMFSELRSYVQLQVYRKSCQINVRAWEQKRAQVNVPTIISIKSRNIDNIQLILERTFLLTKDTHRGCIIVPDGRMVFALCFANQLSVYKKDGMISTHIKVEKCPNDLAVINNNTVAVSCRDSKLINIVNIDEEIVKQSIDVGGACHGLSYYKSKLYVLVKNKGICEFNLDGCLYRTILKDVPDSNDYLSIDNDKFVYTSNECAWNCNILCCDLSGKQIWQSPFADSGITVDQFGNYFAAHYWSNTLKIISTDGKRVKDLLSKRDGISRPEGLYFDKSNNTLLVTCERGMAALYRVI